MGAMLQNWLVRSASEVEQNIVSVERIMHYISIPPEAPYEVASKIDEAWPSRGEIEFREYSTRYRPGLDLVLKDLSFVIVCPVPNDICHKLNNMRRNLEKKSVSKTELSSSVIHGCWIIRGVWTNGSRKIISFTCTIEDNRARIWNDSNRWCRHLYHWTS
jgi:hypothetical protein